MIACPVVAGFVGVGGPRRLGDKGLGADLQLERHGQPAAFGYFIALGNRPFLFACFTTVGLFLHRSLSLTNTLLYYDRPTKTSNFSRRPAPSLLLQGSIVLQIDYFSFLLS